MQIVFRAVSVSFSGETASDFFVPFEVFIKESWKQEITILDESAHSHKENDNAALTTDIMLFHYGKKYIISPVWHLTISKSFLN